MAIQSSYRTLYGKFKFIVSIDGVQSAGFQDCSEITVTIEVMKYHEGGVLVPYKEPGLGEVEDVTMTRGLSRDRDLYDWVLETLDVMAKLPGGTSVPPPNYLRNIVVHQRQRDDTPAVDFPMYWCFPTKWSAGGWNNSESGVTMEQLVVAYHHPSRVHP